LLSPLDAFPSSTSGEEDIATIIWSCRHCDPSPRGDDSFLPGSDVIGIVLVVIAVVASPSLFRFRELQRP